MINPDELNTKHLDELFVKYGTDKGIWGYTPFYANLMGRARFNVRRVLEVGICGHRDIPNNVVGASLFVWRDFFPNAEIFGIDNDPRFVFNDQANIKTACVDAYDHDALHKALVEFGGQPFDMIVDDAVHDPIPQINLMTMLAPWLIHGGHYFMEDVCPYKLPDGNIQHMFDAIDGYIGLSSSRPGAKPEVLVVGVK